MKKVVICFTSVDNNSLDEQIEDWQRSKDADILSVSHSTVFDGKEIHYSACVIFQYELAKG